MNIWTYKKRDLVNESYNDKEVKDTIIKISEEILGFNVDINNENNGKGIDLISVDDPLLGVEVERGGWVGDFWTDDYSLISNLGFRTLNMPDRKEKYWLSNYNMFGRHIVNNSWRKNYFVRTNFFFTQICVVKPETILDVNKTIKATFQVKNSLRIEDWLCWKKEDVETYNLIEGKYVLDTTINGQFPEIGDDEKESLIKLKQKIKRQVKEDEKKRAIEVYRQTKTKKK